MDRFTRDSTRRSTLRVKAEMSFEPVWEITKPLRFIGSSRPLSGIRLWPPHFADLRNALSGVARSRRETLILRYYCDDVEQHYLTLRIEFSRHYKKILYNQSLGQQAFEELMRSMVPRMCPAH